MKYAKVCPLLLAIFLIVWAGGCAPRSGETTPEMAQNMLKLRGYKFTEPELFRAVRMEDATAVRGFLQGGINPNAKNEAGETALTYAILNADPKVARVLMENADLNLKDDAGNAPLHLAIVKGRDELVDLFLEKNAGINVGGKSGKTQNQTPLYAAIIEDREDLIKKLLDKGADPNIADSEGAFPLSEAVVRANANPEVVRMLIEKGANVNAQEPNKNTALMFAAGNKKINSQTRREIIEILLKNGADKSLKGDQGKTALDWAKMLGNADAAELLK